MAHCLSYLELKLHMGNSHTTMTDRQAKFVREYLVDCKGGAAAVRAGYSRAGCRVTAHKLLTEHNAVKAAISASRALDSQRLEIDRLGAIQAFLEAFTVAREQGNPAAMIGAMREVGRMLGFYAPARRQVEMAVRDGQGPIELMTDAELVAAIEARDRV